MEKEIKIKSIGKYAGHSIKANRSIDLTLKFGYDEMTNYILVLQMLNENIALKVKIGDEKGKEIGMFMIGNLSIDGDGEGTLRLKSHIDHVNANEINTLAIGDKFRIMLEAKIDVEEVSEEEAENWNE